MCVFFTVTSRVTEPKYPLHVLLNIIVKLPDWKIWILTFFYHPVKDRRCMCDEITTFIFTSWYFFVTLAGTHWQLKQRWEQHAQFPPQRFTRRQLGQKMASVLISSSRKDTEKLRGVQLYSRTSSLSRFRSAPPQRHGGNVIINIFA